MANAFVKIGTALLKHQMKKLVGEETLGVISEELANIGGDKLDTWLGDTSTIAEIEKAATTARDMFRGKVNDDEIEQWMVMLPIHNLPDVLSAIEELPTSPDETKLENALRESITLNWKRLSPMQVDNVVTVFMFCLRSALLPVSTQTLMTIGRSVLRTEEKVDLLLRWFIQYIITGKTTEPKLPDAPQSGAWNLKHSYSMADFTGRILERKILFDWLEKDGKDHLFVLSALGGFGKSALAWHWLTNDVDSKEYPRVLWWNFYQADSNFPGFLSEALQYLNSEIPLGERNQVDQLLKIMQEQKVLIVMDGFERLLKAYQGMNASYQRDDETNLEENQFDCVNINVEWFLKGVCARPHFKSKVLMTTRLIPRAVLDRHSKEIILGCHKVELTSMQPADAVEFFHKKKINGIRAEIEAACVHYGYHPLSLCILAGLIFDDRDTPYDIAATKKLDITDDIIANKNHVLKIAYDTLTPEQQKLLSTIACFRASMTYDVLKFITSTFSGVDGDDLNKNFISLEARSLLNWDRKTNKYDLHPIVRRYAYGRLSAPDRIATHTHLRDYFATVDVPEHPQTLNDLAPVIEQYHHTVEIGKYDSALDLFYEKFGKIIHYQFGASELEIELLSALFTDNDSPRLTKIDDQAFALNQLANSYSMKGQPHKALSLFEKQISIREKQGANKNIAIGLGNLAGQQRIIGNLRASESNLRRSIDLLQKIQNKRWEAVTHEELGIVLTYRGIWSEAEKELVTAKEDLDLLGQNSFVSSVRVYQAVHRMLLMRSENVYEINQLYSAIDFARSALQLAADWAEFESPIENHFIASHRLLGAAFRIDGQLDRAEQHLIESLTRDRAINFIEYEADILLDLARLRYDQKKYEEAKTLAEEALLITERSGYVLQGADVNLFLAQYALEQEQDKAKAKQYAEEAKKLARCDGPPYYYKVAYEEAERMLAGL